MKEKTISPGFTVSLFEWEARIFSVIVIPIGASPGLASRGPDRSDLPVWFIKSRPRPKSKVLALPSSRALPPQGLGRLSIVDVPYPAQEYVHVCSDNRSLLSAHHGIPSHGCQEKW